MEISTLAGFITGLLTGWIVLIALRSRPDMKGPFWLEPPLRRWWFVRSMWHHAAGWMNRIAIIMCMLILTMQVATGHIGMAWFYFALYCPLAMLFLTNATVRGYRIGLVEQELPRFLTAMTEGMREALGDKTNAAFIDVTALLRVADQYGVPPMEIEQLIWRD